MRSRLRALLVAAAVLALAGCTAIPTSGPVSVQTAKAPNDPGGLVFVPNPPADGASPEEIVGGFVLAAAAANDDYAVARKFLTADEAKAWRPDARVLVHDQGWTTQATDGGSRVSLTVQTSAVVQDFGIYTGPSSKPIPLDYRLQQVRGQWRIADAPEGVLLSRTQFERTFRTDSLQFFDPTYSRFVPDLRWFSEESDTPDMLVRALLRGPSLPIAPNVTATAFPPRTKLAAPVTTSGRVTSVLLTVPGADPSALALKRMQQQLAGVLAPATVSLAVNGVEVPAAAPPSAPQADVNPVVLAGGRFGSLTGQGVTVDPVLGRRIAALEPTAATISPRRLAVVLDARGRAVLVQATGANLVVDDRPELVDPSLDQLGWAWSVPSADPEGLRVRSAKGRVVDLGARLGGTGVVAIEVSPDGTRLLVLVQTDAGPKAYVAGIERAVDGTPIGLTGEQYPVAVNADRAIDATWVDDGSVAVLTSDANGQNQAVSVQQLGGLATTLNGLSNATALVGTTGLDDLRALLQNGDLVERRESAWSSVTAPSTKVSVLAVQR